MRGAAASLVPTALRARLIAGHTRVVPNAARRAARVQVRAAGLQRAGRRPPDGGLWPGG